MRKAFSAIIPLIATALILAGCGKSEKGSSNSNGDSARTAANAGARKVLYWYDPMTPTIHFNHPGKSPTMDMDLVPMYADQEDSNPNVVRIDPTMVQNIGVVTAPVERRRLTRTINTYGVVMPDEKNINDINTRVSGWIEKLYFDYTGMDVQKGQPMAVIYSPELIAAEQEFLQSVSFADVSENTVTQSNSLISSARERLRFFGMSDNEINELQKTGKVIDRVTIYSPGEGVILEKDVFEGQKISEGQSLFKVANLYHVWILADVFKIDMPFLKLGSPATLTYNSGETYSGAVDFVYPEVDVTARSVKVRIPLYNPGMTMKVGQYVNVAIHSPVSYNAVAVPSQAVINTGLRKVVAVALGGGRFEIRQVELGAYADGYYEVLDGLNVGDTIVTSGQFLIDSDANLKSAGTAMAGMAMPPSSPQPSQDRSQSGDLGNLPGMNMPSTQQKASGKDDGMNDMPGMNHLAPQKKTSGKNHDMDSMPGMNMKTKKKVMKKNSMEDTAMPGMNMGKEKKQDAKNMDMNMPGMDMKSDTTGQEN